MKDPHIILIHHKRSPFHYLGEGLKKSEGILPSEKVIMFDFTLLRKGVLPARR